VALLLRWSPLRRILERAADFCSQLWDRIVQAVLGHRSPSSTE